MTVAADISVIVPTIAGREEWLAKCIKLYEWTTPGAEIIVITDAPTCGVAWGEGAALATRRYLHFTADDLTPLTGWWEAAVSFVKAGLMPAAMIKTPGGGLALCNSPLGDMGMWPNILAPFLSREMVEQGGWFQPFHYGTDDWVTYRAVQLGYDVRRCAEYALVHWVASEGRDYTRRYGDVKALAAAMSGAGYLPPVYAKLEENLRDSETGLAGVDINQLNNSDAIQLHKQDNQFAWQHQGA